MKTDPICQMQVEEVSALTGQCDGETFYFCSEGCRDRFLQGRVCSVPGTSYDLIIIGGGPAGLTAAVYADMLKIDAFLITRDLGGQAIDSTRIENYMGYDFITGPELISKFREQLVHSHYIDHLIGDVEKVEVTPDGFNVTTDEHRVLYARALVVATGMTRRVLGVPGEEQFQRKGVFYGNLQDYSFVTGQDVAVVGGGNSAVQIVEKVRTVAKNIHLISDSLKADPALVARIRQFPNLRIYEGHKVVRFDGGETLSGVVIREAAGEKSRDIPVKGVFIAIGLEANSGLVGDLVSLNEKGEIVIAPDCSTSLPGLFAAGDVTDAFGKRIIISSGEGAKAAMAARRFLLDMRKPAG